MYIYYRETCVNKACREHNHPNGCVRIMRALDGRGRFDPLNEYLTPDGWKCFIRDCTKLSFIFQSWREANGYLQNFDPGAKIKKDS